MPESTINGATLDQVLEAAENMTTFQVERYYSELKGRTAKVYGRVNDVQRTFDGVHENFEVKVTSIDSYWTVKVKLNYRYRTTLFDLSKQSTVYVEGLIFDVSILAGTGVLNIDEVESFRRESEEKGGYRL